MAAPVTDRVITADEGQWLVMEERSAVGAARRQAQSLAHSAGFSDERVAGVGLAVTELGTNLVKHAQRGLLLMRRVRVDDEVTIEVVAVDRGPGMADLDAALRDGHSTAGTLGVGLGTVERQADRLRAVSEPGVGTVLAATFHGDRQAPPGRSVAGLVRALGSEPTCGDQFAARQEGDRVTLMLCDGSGHGPLAADAAYAAVRAFNDGPTDPPEVVVRRVHTALSGSRGGAVSIADLHYDQGVVRFCGVGNVAGSVSTESTKRMMVSVPGIVGYHLPKVRTFDYELPPDGVVVLHTDGISAKWDLSGRRGLLSRDALLIAATLLRDAAGHRDDAGVLVGRRPAP
ncbi:ATP-binding protein [Actinokineospora guangxiensis]|uniref:ATP-binding protein n=1 Tax=Actinokineospora guangxiensis TaxID=1490288 RepID=A0ABW0EV30_9PSEU